MEVLDAVGAKLNRAVTKVKSTGDISPSVISSDICQQLKRIHFMKVSLFFIKFLITDNLLHIYFILFFFVIIILLKGGKKKRIRSQF